MFQQTLFEVENDPAEEAARSLIRYYVKRGDDPKSLRDSHLGGYHGHIGGWCDPFEEVTENKHYSTDYIIVERDMNGKRVCRVFRFQDIYDAILAE